MIEELKTLSKEELEKAYEVLDKLYEECVKTLKMIPPCPCHGAMCQSYYREWLTFHAVPEYIDAKVRVLRDELKQQDEKLETIRELVG